MIVAILTVHRFVGFFMNWTGTQKGEGFEFHLLVLAIVTYLIIQGREPFPWIDSSRSEAVRPPIASGALRNGNGSYN